MNDSLPVLTCEALSKSFRDANHQRVVLDDLNLTVAAGESVAIVGASGSGKSTLLHLLAGLDVAESGDVAIAGCTLASLTERARDQWRNAHLGFVHQFHHLLPEFSAVENVAMPLLIRGVGRRKAGRAALEYLAQVGLGDRAAQSVMTLSGGERQRVAIARALVTEPSCLLADEPTGNLDEENADSVFDLLCRVNKESGTALVIVTHNRALANTLERQLLLERGKLRLL